MRIVQIVNKVLSDLQPAGNIFLQYLLVKIVHVVMFLHWALSAVRPASEAGRRQETVVGGTGCKELEMGSVNPSRDRDTVQSGLPLTDV